MSSPLIFRNTLAITQAIEFVSQRLAGDDAEHELEHLREVARLLFEATEGNDDDLVVAGLLHHTLESKIASVEELSGHFNISVAALVAEVTEIRAAFVSESTSPDMPNFQHYSDRAMMLFAADMVAIQGGSSEDIPKPGAVRAGPVCLKNG